MLDIFKQNAFSVISLTDAVNKRPFIPGRAGQVIPWNEQGVATTTIAVEQVDGVLSLINPTPRGAPGSTAAKDKRTVRDLRVPHYQIDDAIYAEEVQGVRAFGSESVVQTVRSVVDQRMADHVQTRLDPTLEYQRIGAVKGVIVNGDGTTLYDLFDEFDVTQETEIDFDLDAGSPASGAVRKKCTDVVRLRHFACRQEGVQDRHEGTRERQRDRPDRRLRRRPRPPDPARRHGPRAEGTAGRRCPDRRHRCRWRQHGGQRHDRRRAWHLRPQRRL